MHLSKTYPLCTGSQDQGNLPHVEHVQLGCDAEVSDRGVLVPSERPRQDSARPEARHGQLTFVFLFTKNDKSGN